MDFFGILDYDGNISMIYCPMLSILSYDEIMME